MNRFYFCWVTPDDATESVALKQFETATINQLHAQVILHYITLSSFKTPLTPKVTSGASTITCYTKSGPPRGGQGGQMPRGPATFRGPAGPTVNIVNMRYERALYKRALYERARDRSAQGPGFSLGGPVQNTTHRSSMQANVLPITNLYVRHIWYLNSQNINFDSENLIASWVFLRVLRSING